MRVAVCLVLVAVASSACATTQGDVAHGQLKTLARETRWQELYERGRAFAAVGDFTRAEEYFASALENGGDSQKLIPLLLYCCMQDGRFLLAAQYAEEHLRKHPSDYRTRFVLGSIYAGLGDAAPAERELRRVVEMKPLEAEAHFALAKILRDNQKSYAEADLHFREYLRLTPKGMHAGEAQEHLLHTVPEAAPQQLAPSRPQSSASSMPQPLAPVTSSTSSRRSDPGGVTP